MACSLPIAIETARTDTPVSTERADEAAPRTKRKQAMDTLQAIRTRRSIRKYRQETVREDVVREILRAGMMAPSARNSQPCRI